MTWLRRYFRRRQVARGVTLSADGARIAAGCAGQRDAEDGRHIRALRL